MIFSILIKILNLLSAQFILFSAQFLLWFMHIGHWLFTWNVNNLITILPSFVFIIFYMGSLCQVCSCVVFEWVTCKSHVPSFLWQPNTLPIRHSYLLVRPFFQPVWDKRVTPNSPLLSQSLPCSKTQRGSSLISTPHLYNYKLKSEFEETKFLGDCGP